MHEEYKNSLERILQDHEARITRLEERYESIDQRLDDMDKKIDLLIKLVSNSKASQKTMITILVIILTFIAAMFGLGWRPP